MKYRSLLSSILLALATGLNAATTIYLATNYGPLKSTDGGVSFTQLKVEVSNPFINSGVIHQAGSIAVDPRNSNIVYFAGKGPASEFYKSTDGGQSWSGVVLPNFTFNPPPTRLAIDPVLTNVLYAVANNGDLNVVIKSTDAGLTWNQAAPLPLPAGVSRVDADTISIDPAHSGVLFAVANAYVYKSVDFGNTWDIQANMTKARISRVFVNPHNSQVLYATTGFRNTTFTNCAASINNGQCGVFKSIDGGKNWLGLNIPGIETGSSVTFDAGTSTVYASVYLTGLHHTLMRTIDGGATWTPLYNQFGATYEFFAISDPSAPAVYAITDQFAEGFYRSTNAGVNFTRLQLQGCTTPQQCSNLVGTNDFAVAPGAAAPPPPVTGPTRTISHIANGDGWRTTTILINTGTQLESFELKFWDENGNPLPLDLGADGVTANLVDAIQPGVARFIRTAGTGTLKPGWAELRSSLDIDGNSIFGLQSPGHGDSEAAVPLSPSGGTELFIPFDYSTGYSTGVAFADPGQQLANVTATILDDAGANVPAAGTIMVPDRGHYANVLAAKFPGVVGKRGVAQFTSTANIFGLGIRANGKAFTSIDALAGVTAATKTIPHIANGGGWKTTFLIVCADTHAANFTLKFWHDDGTPFPLPLVAGGIVTSITGTLQPGEIRIVEAVNTGPLVTGWAELSGLTGGIGGTAIFALQSPGQADAEAAVPFSTAASTHLFMPYDYSPGYSTAIAVTNTGGTAAHVTATFTDDAGNNLGSGPPIIVPAHGHNSAVLVLLKPAIAGTRGTVSFTSDVPVFGLGLRANGVAFTSLKVIAK